MKKFIKLFAVSALALAMLLSLASCSLFEKMEIGDVEDAMKDLAKEDEEVYMYEKMDKTSKKAFEEALTDTFDLKGGIEGMAQITDIEEAAWCLAVEYEKGADAKAVEKDLEDNIVDLMVAVSLAAYEEVLNESGLDSSEIKEMLKEYEDEVADGIEEEGLLDDFVVVRKGNTVFCGNEDLIDTVIEAVEDAK